MRWFRFYDDALNDPKVQRLPGDEFKSWVNLLCLASKHGGSVPPLADTAFLLRMPEKQVAELFGRLATLGLLDEVDGEYRPHNWAARQYASDQSTPRVKKTRNGGVTPDVTPPETETEADTKSEKKIGGRAAYPNDFEEFWKKYPTDSNMAKKTTLDIWKKLSGEDRSLATKSLSGFRDYCETNKSWYRPVHAVKYLRDRRFEGHAETSEKLSEVVFDGVVVVRGTPQWVAWEAFERSAGRDMHYSPRIDGWRFATEYPPQMQAAE